MSGKFHVFLNRVVDVSTLPVVNRDMLQGDLEMERRGWPATINEVKVIFPRMVDAGEIHGCGYDYGQWGNYIQTRPEYEVTLLEHNDKFLGSILSLAGCEWHTLVVKASDRTLWCTGYCQYGSLGQGDGVTWLEVFTQIGSDGDWAEVCCTAQASYMRKTDGTLYSCGRNRWGQLGLGDTTDRWTPNQILGGWGGWRALPKAGAYATNHMVAVGSDGKLWGWGQAGVGELGLGSEPPSYYDTPQQIGVAQDWVRVALGEGQSFAINDSNELWATGNNADGQLGLGDDVNRFVLTKVPGEWLQIASAQSATLGIKIDGTLWAAGYSQFGELGLGDAAVGQAYYSFTQVGEDTDWVDVVMGSVHSIARKRDGTLWSCGSNWQGQLGVGDTDDRTVFTQMGVMNEWRLMTGMDCATVVAGDLR